VIPIKKARLCLLNRDCRDKPGNDELIIRKQYDMPAGPP